MQEDRALDYYLSRAFQRLDLPDVASEMKVERVYRQLAGDLISKLTPKVSYHEGELSLKLSSAALKHEMLMRRESLMQKMNEALGGNIVRRIQLL